MAKGAMVKGITINIGANTEEFQKGLAKVNKESKATANKLRDINKLLKLDPKNVELLEQKQRTLNTSIEQTKKRLDIAKDALKQLKEQNPDQVTEEMDALERQIAEDEAQLKSLNKELKNFGSVGKQQAQAFGKELQEVGKKVSEVGAKVKGVGDSLTTHVTAPIVALGGASLAAFNEVDNAYDTVIKKTGATGEAAQGLYDIIDNLATSIPTDFDTAANAVGEVNTRFGLTGDALQDLSEKFIMFAELNDTDVSTSVDTVQKALEAFGLGAEDAGSYLDALNKAAQDSGIGVDTLTNLTIQNSTALQDMGLSLEDSTALMAQLEKSGVPVETVMGGLSKALKKATDEGKPLDEALSDLQKTISDSDDDAKGLAKSYELFGKSGDKVFKAVKDGAIDFENLTDVATESAGSVSDTFNETLDPIDQWQMTMNELKLVGADLGATLGEILLPVLQGAGDVIRDLKEKWESLSPEQQKMIEQVALAIAVIGPIVSIIGSIIMGIGGLITAVGTITAVLGIGVGAFAGIIAIIAAVIAIIVVCITHWDDIKAKVKEVWESISTYMSNLKEDITKKWNDIKQQIAEKIQSIKTDVQEKWAQIKSDTIQKFTDMKNDALQKIIDLKDGIKKKIDDIKGFFTDLVLKIPTPELPKLPHFSLETSSKEILGKTITYPTGFDVEWYAKAMNNPYLFTQPTIVGAGEAGAEVMYGRDNLMRDIATATAANNESLIDGIYVAISTALRQADLTVEINEREFGRIVREARL